MTITPECINVALTPNARRATVLAHASDELVREVWEAYLVKEGALLSRECEILDMCSRELANRHAPEHADELARCRNCGWVAAWHDEASGDCLGACPIPSERA